MRFIFRVTYTYLVCGRSLVERKFHVVVVDHEHDSNSLSEIIDAIHTIVVDSFFYDPA